MGKKIVDEQKMVQEVLDHFDWIKCHQTMNLLNWEWYFVGVPTIGDLKECAQKLFETAIQGVKNPSINYNSFYFVATGGLKAIAWKNKFGHIVQLELEFVLTSWESDGDYFDED
jgi:hypothetical protein